jgi:hypothetical protein
MRLVLALALMCAVSALPSSSLWQRNGPKPDEDPLGKHCFDVSVDTSDSKAMEWLSANNYTFATWKEGLCDSSVWPNVESSTHPGVTLKVTERKLGHGAAVAEAMVVKTKDCRSDKTTEPIDIAFTNGAPKATAKIRGCQDQYACKPYQDCELALAAGATETITIDSSFKYFVFLFKPSDGGDHELYPDANMKYPTAYTIKPKSEVVALSESDYVINSPSPGNHAHCTEISFAGGKSNPYYESHGYQYQPPIWSAGPCAKKYNWFNRNTTIADGVTQTELGVHT